MISQLGPRLAEPTVWEVSDAAVPGELAATFDKTEGVHKWLHYLPVYEATIDRNRPIRMLEIGVFQGGSLRMWRAHLHPDSTIVGIDINPECKRYESADTNVHVRIGSQADTEFLDDVTAEFGPFDVIIDDGSHMASHMIASFRHLFLGSLTDTGIYIVEDMHSNFWTSHRDSAMSFVDFIGVLVAAMHAPYQIAQNEESFRTGHPSRLRSVMVPAITPVLDSIEVRDSMMIARRRRRDLPRTVVR